MLKSFRGKEIRVYGRLFTLVTIDDDSQVFAWGIEIVGAVGSPPHTEAETYRTDPARPRTRCGVHDSAQAACDRWSSIVPLEICWEESYVPHPASDSAAVAIPEASSGSRPRPLATV